MILQQEKCEEDNMNELVSVIVPVYNAADHLDKCINSIVTQTYRMIELILVNDGSTDQSATICAREGSTN